MFRQKIEISILCTGVTSRQSRRRNDKEFTAWWIKLGLGQQHGCCSFLLVCRERQVDHNGDKVMEWEEFTGFVIDQVIALTREAPRDDKLQIRHLGPRDKVIGRNRSNTQLAYLERAVVYVCVLVRLCEPVFSRKA